MKSWFRNAYITLLSRPINPNPNFPSNFRFLPFISSSPPLHPFRKSQTFRSPTAPLCISSMAGGDSHALNSSPPSLEKQFEVFRVQLDESGSLRDRIRGVVNEIESATRLMHAGLLLVHHSRAIPVEVVEKAKAHISVLKELYGKLAEVLCECHGQYYRYHGDWRSATQTVVSLLAFMHWLETGSLLMHTEAEEKLGLNNSDFGLDVEDYLVGICFMSNEMPRFVVNQVTAGDYDCPRKVLNFLTDLHAAFRMLNLRNDFLRKKFDSMKYDVKRVEEVHYDVKIRGLTTTGDSTGDQVIQEPSVGN
ncbi:Translin domain-containing protein [Cephalotus follicularis]|uniref:Translin domain-containing protein n=1 Tax=Cephalotus follicularis TaxID=3775 RepID=A0A1Q3BIS8_CEPFO|nr:Translin domain-containing protein [Cephalotus follicularis]